MKSRESFLKYSVRKEAKNIHKATRGHKLAYKILLLCIGLALLPSKQAAAFTVIPSQDKIEIRSYFKGTTLKVFGINMKENYDIIVTVKGDVRNYKIYKKNKKFHLWLNGSRKIFNNAYKFYFITSNVKNPAQHFDASLLRQYELGLNNLPLHSEVEERSSQSKESAHTEQNSILKTLDDLEYRQGFLESQKRKNLYVEKYGNIKYSPKNDVFQASIDIPKNISGGSYIITTFFIKDNVVQRAVVIPLTIKETGLSNIVKTISKKHKILYTFMCIMTSVILAMISYNVKKMLNRKILERRMFDV